MPKRNRANKRYGLTHAERLELAEQIRVAFNTRPTPPGGQS